MVQTLPCRRRFDEKIVAICSKYPSSFAALLKKYNIHISYVIGIGGMVEKPNHPIILNEMILENYRDIKIYVDGNDKEIEEEKDFFIKENIEFLEIEKLEKKYPNIMRECTSDNLYISMSGDVYQCPKMIERLPITSIKRRTCIKDLVDFIPEACSCKRGYITKSKAPLIVNKISIEFGGLCNAACIYCYQTYNKKRTAQEYTFAQLDDFLNQITFNEIVVAGGEVMCQKETLEYLECLKAKRPNIKISLKTNGFSDDYQKAIELFDDILVSINCFSEKNLRLIMGSTVRLQSMKNFCEKICSDNDTKISIKYLLTPISLMDIPDFLKWASELRFEEIAFTKAMLFGVDTVNSWTGSSFYNLNNIYWAPIFERNRKVIREIIDSCGIDCDKLNLRMEQGTKELLGL